MPNLFGNSSQLLTIFIVLIAFGCTHSGAKEEVAGNPDSTIASNVATTKIDSDIGQITSLHYIMATS